MPNLQVTAEQAYAEACQALGEAIVEKRMMAKAASDQIEELKSALAEAKSKS